MSTGYTGSSDKVVNSKYLYDRLKDFKNLSDSNYASKTSEHIHSNKESVLDKLGKNSDGDLTFNGNIVSDNSASVVNHLANGNIHVDANFKTNTNTHIANNNIHMSTDEKKTLNNAYQKPIGGIPKTDLSSTFIIVIIPNFLR